MATSAKKAPAKKTAPAKAATPAKKIPSTPVPAKVAAAVAAKKDSPKKTLPSPPKKADAPPPVAKKAPPKEEPKEPVFTGLAEAEPAPPEKKGSASDTLDRVAAERGWVQSPAPENFDVCYTKSNPVLGGYEHLRVAFKGTGIGEIEHENLNRPIPFPTDGSKLDNAISVLTGEPA